MQRPIPVLIIVGPTAVGKTRLAFELFERFSDIEVISADSRQIFRLMDIGTAKPTPDELKSLPHHCIDIKYPDEYFSAGEYGRLAPAIVHRLLRNHRFPLVVGGSGLYIRSLVDGLFSGDARDAEIKKSLQERADREGLQPLYAELSSVDPAGAAAIHPNDRQRIVRALEVWQLTGEPISSLRRKKTYDTGIKPVFVGLNRPRTQLYEIINGRAEQMIAGGLIDEVERLRNRGYGPGLQSQKTVGYREIHDFLDGKIDKKSAVDLIKRNSRRFAKRQITWFSRDTRVQWLSLENEEDRAASRRCLIEKISELREEHSRIYL